MTPYSLSALLRLRELKKGQAQREWKDALWQHEMETEALRSIEASLIDAKSARRRLQEELLLKSRISPLNKTAVTCHQASQQKNILEGEELMKRLAGQKLRLQRAIIKLDVAKATLIDSERRLMVLKKHFARWQRAMRCAEELSRDYENDDQNATRFSLKRA